MKTIDEIRDYLLENRVDEDGGLDLTGLDFSDFDGDVYISEMKVKRDLYQSFHKVQGDLLQSWHEIQGNYYSRGIIVNGDIVFEKPTNMLKKITIEELKEMGYELTEDY